MSNRVRQWTPHLQAIGSRRVEITYDFISTVHLPCNSLDASKSNHHSQSLNSTVSPNPNLSFVNLTNLRLGLSFVLSSTTNLSKFTLHTLLLFIYYIYRYIYIYIYFFLFFSFFYFFFFKLPSISVTFYLFSKFTSRVINCYSNCSLKIQNCRI